MKYKHVIKETLIALKTNFSAYVSIWLISEIIAFLFMKFVTKQLFTLALRDLGLSSITNENFLMIFTNISSILLILICIITIGLIALIQMLVIFNIMLNNGNLKTLIRPLTHLKVSDIIPLIFYTLIIIPFSKFGLTLYFVSSLKIPSFVLSSLNEHLLFVIFNVFIIVGFLYLSVRYFYSFLIFYQKDVSFKEAMNESFEYTNLNFIKTISFLLFVYALTIGAGIGEVALLHVFDFLGQHAGIFQRIVVAVGVTLCVKALLLINMFHSLFLLQVTLQSYGHKTIKLENKGLRFISKVVSFATLWGLFFISFFSYAQDVDLNHVAIISHRGDLTAAIENTTSSLIAANKKGADYVELDIVELLDNNIILLHDNNLKRLTGLNKHVKDLNSEDIRALSLRQKDLEAPIDFFDDYLKVAKTLNQKLLIEIKPDARDSDEYLSNIFKMVSDHNMEDMVVYQSLNKNIILRLKALDPSIKAGYIIGINIDGIEDIDVDFYAIEASSMNDTIDRTIKTYNKGLIIWSVDTVDIIQVAFAYNPTGIVTDQIERAQSVRDQLSSRPVYRMLWKLGF